MRRQRIAEGWGNARRRNAPEGHNITVLHGKGASSALGATRDSSFMKPHLVRTLFLL